MSGVLQARSILAKGHSIESPVTPPRSPARLLYSTALQSIFRIAALSGLVATALLATPTLAQNTKGGDGGQGNSAPSPVGGTSSLTGTGGPGSGTSETYEGAGGGGAGATGGKGGDASNGGLGGAGGATAGASGGNGVGGGIGSRASGGGGGAHGAVVVSTSTPGTTVIGGMGGAGGDSSDGDGGGGGAGGYGIVVDTAGPVVFNNAINGGNGGRGGYGYFYGGSGGDGGHGLAFSGGATVTLNGAVSGGNGGMAGAFVASGCCATGNNGRGGTGIVGSDISLVLNAVVSGGLAGDGVTRAPAMRLGGSSRVTLGTGWGFAGGIVVDNAGNIDFAQSTNVTLGDAISGAGSISKSGAGTLTLTGTNSYAGGTTITGGLVNFSNNGNLGSGNLTLNGGGLQWAAGNTLDVSARLNAIGAGGGVFDTNGNNITLTGGLSGGGLVKSGIGMLTLTGANSYSGGTTITGGLINFANGGNLGIGNITLNAGGLQWAAGNTLDISSRLNPIGASGGVLDTNGNNITLAGGLGGGGLVKSGTGMLILTGTNSYGATMISAGSLQIGNGGGLGTLGGGNVTNNATLRFNRSGTLTVSNAISGAGNVIQAGTGTAILSGANSYSGLTTVQSGTLNVRNSGALGSSGAGTVVESGATLEVQGSITLADALTLNGTGVANGGALRGVSSYNFLNGAVFLQSDTRINGDGPTSSPGVDELVLNGPLTGNNFALTFGGVGRTSANGAINGIASLTKDGAGVLALTNTNVDAPITISAGILQFVGGAAVADNAAVVVNSPALIQLANSETIGSLAGSGNVQMFFGTTLTAGANNSSTTFSGALLEANPGGAFTKAGTGSMTLAGANSYTGATIVQAGTLVVANASALGTAAGGTVVQSGASLHVEGGVTVAGEALTINGTGIASGGALRGGTGTNSYSGAITLGSNARINADGGFNITNVLNGGGNGLTVGGTGGVYFSAGINGISSLTKDGTGIAVMYGANSYTGPTTVNAGTLQLDSGSAIGDGSTVVVNGSGILRVSTSETVGSLSGAGSLILQSGAILTIGGDNSSTIFSGNSIDQIGAGGLSKVGAGTLTLTGTNSYTGATTIGAGTLQIGNGGGSGTLGTGNIVNNAALVIDRSDTLTAANRVTGNGTLRQSGLGTTVLAGNNIAGQAFTGAVFVDSGRLAIDGNFGDVTGNSTQLVVGEAGTLGGSGTFFGNVDAQNGTLAPGNSPGTLTIAGNLTLGAGTILNFELGEAGTVGGPNNDLVNVGGNLILDGTLNTFAAAPAYGPGYYRLFNYGGTLTDNGLLIGSIAGGFTPTVLTNIDGQVNLLLGDGAGQIVQYWDGADTTGGSAAANGNGGAGAWNAGGTNWTTPTGYAVNDRWQSQVGVFGGAAGGTVSIGGTQSFQELRFVTDGYTFAGSGGLATTGGFSVIDVENGLGAAIEVTISGAGGLTKTGAGTLTLSGANSYAGVTTVSEGTLALSSTGSLAGNVMNSATFNNAGTVAGRVTNNATLISTGILAGGLVNNGTASVQNRVEGDVSNLAGTITLTGATGGIARFDQLAGATFDLAGFSTAIGALNGAGTVQLGSNAGSALTVGDSSSSSFAGTIAGAGGLAKAGNGTLTLAGANSYTGTTRVDAGTLALAATGSLAGNVENSAIFSNAGTVAGVVINDGTFTSTGILAGGLVNNGAASLQNRVEGDVSNLAGTITLTGATVGITNFDQASGATFDLAGFSAAIGALSGAGDVQLGGNAASALTTGDASSTLFAGTIAGSGRLVKTGTGTLTLTGANSHSGGTLILAGALRLGDGGTSGSISGPIEVNGTLIIDRSDSFALTNALSGTGSLVQAGSGTTVLSGANGLTGGFTVAKGRLRGDAVAFGANNIRADGTIEFAQAAAGSYAGQISGGGAFEKTGAGRLTLTGTSGFTGQTRLLGGELSVNGSLAQSALSVGASSRLSGTGTVGAVTVASGGTIAPGNSIGTLNVNGDITFAAGAIYEVEVDPSGTATDLIAATGRAILNGGSVVHIGLNGNYRPQATYTILTAAGGVQGTFADVSSNFAFLDPTLGYGANAVTLTLERNDIDFADVADTANQRSAATGVNQLGFGNPVFDTVLVLDAAGARGAFDLLSSEIYASLQAALVQDSRFVRGAALTRMRHAGAAVDAEPGLRFWMQGLGSRGHLDGDGNSRRMKQDSAGFLLGVDAIADETVQLGAFGGYQQGDASVRAAASDADIDSYHLGVYAGTDLGALGLRAGYAFSWHQADVSRRIAFANFADTITADYDASTAQAFAEIGYRLDFGAARIEPFAQIARIWVDSERLGERGGAAALEVARAKMSTSVSTLGARLDQGFSLGSVNASLQLSASWRHAFGDRLPLTMNSFGGSSPFAIAGAPIARDAFAADIGIDFALSERVRFGVAYSGDVARRAESHAGRATFSWTF